jgi:hypothetical protein
MGYAKPEAILWKARFLFSLLGKAHKREILVGPFPNLDELNKWRLCFIGELASHCKLKRGVSFFPYSEMVDEFNATLTHPVAFQKPARAAMNFLASALHELIRLVNSRRC